MNCKRLKIFLVFIFLFLLSHSFGQTTNDSSDTGGLGSTLVDSLQNNQDEPADTSISKMSINGSEDSIKNWKRSPGFGYMAYMDSLLKKKNDIRVDTISITEGGKKNTSIPIPSSNGSILNSAGVKIFLWALAVFFILFILYRLVFKGGLFQKTVKYNQDEIIPSEPESLVEYDTYNKMIYDAETGNDYNLAVRYLYLQSLKRLSDNELILFSPDKTNDKYVRELSARNYQPLFGMLTSSYEYIWYGKFSIDRDRYDQLKNEFITFNKKI